MINTKCCFMHSGQCCILIRTACTGCKFRKSGMEYIADREHAAHILERKGLEAYRDGDVITTRDREESE